MRSHLFELATAALPLLYPIVTDVWNWAKTNVREWRLRRRGGRTIKVRYVEL